MVERISVPAPTLSDRATRHRALGDETRLRLVDALQVSDRSPRELAELTGVPSNLLAFHLGVLEEANLVRRTASRGDARRRYVTLVRDRLEGLDPPPPLPSPAEHVLFVCTANAARSQLASHLWHARTGRPALSAGTDPAPEVHPGAVDVARRHGVDLTGATPTTYEEVTATPDLVVSVCDRAHESHLVHDAPLLHWSIPDPVPADEPDAFEQAFAALHARVEQLASAVGA
jgi:ArsR family transcriptional regulator, arsenate/arsenite/antimonite-responsive transcriptional repressor / arsenate reductase (thioredoxin)